MSLLGLFAALPIISIIFKNKSDTSIATILCYYGFSLLILGSVTFRLGQSQEVEYPQHLRSRVTTSFALPAYYMILSMVQLNLLYFCHLYGACLHSLIQDMISKRQSHEFANRILKVIYVYAEAM